MKRKKRYPRVMVTLLLLVAIVLIILLFRHIAANEVINTTLIKTDPNAVAAVNPADVQPQETQPADVQPAVPEARQAEDVPVETVPLEEVPAAPAASGTVVDTGIIRSVCPDGWMSVQLTDVYGEKDENGNYPQDLTRMGFCKGGTTQADVFSKLTTYILFANGALSDNTISNSAMWYTETTPITATINGIECQGFHAVDEDLFNEGAFYEYDILFRPVDDEHHVEFQIMTAAPDINETLSLDDPDVRTILDNFAID